MQVRAAPLMLSGILAASSPIRSYIMVAVQASGRMVMSIGPLVSRPPTSLWWSMIACTSAPLILAGSSAGLLVSTTTQGWPSSTSAMMSSMSKPQRCSMKAASVLGWPSRTGLASTPLTSFRYQAQISGEPVESVSGDLWPKTRVVMSRNLLKMRKWGEFARLIEGGSGFVTPRARDATSGHGAWLARGARAGRRGP